MAVSGVTSAGAQVAAMSNGQRIADNFTTFLQLLTTQLQNQNPLDPLDTNQFTQQLVQFAGVDQQIATNTTLSAVLQAMDSSRLTGAVDFIGKRIVAEGATTVLDEQSAVWNINVGEDAPKTTVVIFDASGKEVYSQDVNLAAGDNVYAWQGKSSSGQILPDGFYTIQVVGRDAQGKMVAAKTDIQGVVTGVELEDGQPVLKMGDTVRVKLTNMKSVVNVASGD